MKAAKAVAAAIGVFITVAVAGFADNIFDSDWASIGGGLFTMIATIAAVYRVPNKRMPND